MLYGLGMDIRSAIALVSDSHAVRRPGWPNGEFLMMGTVLTLVCPFPPGIQTKIAWFPLREDLLAEDWDDAGALDSDRA